MKAQESFCQMTCGVVVTVFVLLELAVYCSSYEILHAPENTTVFLNQSASFKCETTGGLPGWKVNGSLLQDLPHDIGSDVQHTISFSVESRVESLIIAARARYNGTKVQCVVFTFASTSIESKNATMMIQGSPSAIDELKTVYNETSTLVIISWTAPFSLDVNGVDPDIIYSVFIYNVTDENNPTKALYVNVTETKYTFILGYLNPCHVYNFSVIPFNGAGAGPVSSHLSSPHDLEVSRATDVLVHGANVTVLKQSSDVYFVLITIPFTASNTTVLCLPEQLMLWYENVTEQCTGALSVVSPQLSHDQQVWNIMSEVVIQSGCEYTLHFTSPNGTFDNTNSSGSLSISTRVIKVEVKVLKEEVVVRCVFRHTLSERCYIQLVSSELKEKFHKGECVVGKEQASHSFPDLLLAIYTVLVYGLAAGEELCSPGGPDYITLVTVHHPHPTPITLHPIFNPTYNSSSVLNSVSTTDRTRSVVNLQESSSHLLSKGQAGFGVGLGVGIVTTSIIFATATITIKVCMKHRQPKSESPLPAENPAYGLHSTPQPQTNDISTKHDVEDHIYQKID